MSVKNVTGLRINRSKVVHLFYIGTARTDCGAGGMSDVESNGGVRTTDPVTCKRCLKTLAAEVAEVEHTAHAMNDVLTAARSTGQPVLTVTPVAAGAALALVKLGLLVDNPEGFMDPLAHQRRQSAATPGPIDKDAVLEPSRPAVRTAPYAEDECPGFDPGNVLAGYDGRACVNCGVREPNGYTAHGLVERDDERTAADLPESSAAIALLVQGLPLAEAVALLETAAAYGSGRTWYGGKPWRVEVGAARGTFRVFPKLEGMAAPTVGRADANGQRPDGTTVASEPDQGPELTTDQVRDVLVRGGLPEDRAVALLVAAGSEPYGTLKSETVFRGRRYLVARRWINDRWRVAVR